MLDVENSRICLQTEVNGNGRFWAGSGQAAFGSTSPQSGMAGYDNKADIRVAQSHTESGRSTMRSEPVCGACYLPGAGSIVAEA